VRKEEKHVSLYYEIGEEIGSGSFGKVFKIKHKKFQENRALKVVNKVEKENYTSFEELEILKKLDHPNILKIYEYYESPSKWYIVTEFFEGN
jgi:serine/threonine protein kinase